MAASARPAPIPFDPEVKVIRYHVFTDGWDDFSWSFDEAKGWYAQHVRQHRPTRLFYEGFASMEEWQNDRMIEENHIAGVGRWPL